MKLWKTITSWLLILIMMFSATVLPTMATDTMIDPGFVDELKDDDGDGIEDEKEIEIVEDNRDSAENVNIGDFDFQEEIKNDETDLTKPKGYIDNTEFLSALGIYSFSDRLYRDCVTRGEFARMMMDLLGGEYNTSEQLPFSDVTDETQYADAISFVFHNGLMNGVSSESFRPEDYITYMQALKTVINALGYNELAEAQGGYPNGYMKLGQKLDLMKKVQGDYNAPLSFEAAAVLLCLAAETPVCEAVSVTYDSTHYASDSKRLLINVYHNIYTDKGIMTDNGRTAVNRKTSLSLEKVLIGGRELFCTNNSIRDLIGQNITYYYNDNSGIYTLLYAYVDSRYNDIVTLRAQQIDDDNSSLSKTCVVANVDGRVKNYKIDIYANLLYNGIFDETFTKESFKITEGTVTLIDADKDGDYELISIEEYVDIVVGGHVPNDSVAALFTVPGYGSVIYRDCDNVIFEDSLGKEIEPSAVMKGHVLSVYKSKDGEMIRFVHSVNSKRINVESIEEDEDNILLGYDGEEFLISHNYMNLMKTMPHMYSRPVSGTYYEVYINFENKIVMLEQSFGKKQYAYLLKMANGKGLRSDEIELLMHLETDDSVVVTAKDKISINGVKGQSADKLWNNTDLIVDGKFVPQLVSVVLNSKGMLKSIETDNDPLDDFLVLDPDGDGVLDDRDTTKIEANKQDYSLRFRPGKFSLDYYLGDGYSGPQYQGIDFRAIYGCVCVTEETKIFLVGRTNRNMQTDDPDEVKVISYADYSGGLIGNSPIKVYDTDITWKAGAAVVTQTVPASWTLFYVDDTAYVTDAYGETKLRVTGYYGDQGYYTFRVYDEALVKDAVLRRYPGSDGRLKKGDVIQIGRDFNGEIGSVSVFYSPQRDKDPNYNFIDVWSNTEETERHVRFASSVVMVLGRLCALQDGRFGIFTKGNPDYIKSDNSYTTSADYATDCYWVHSANKGTAYFHFDCETKELKQITLHDIVGGSDFSMDSYTSGDGSYSLADFTNYDESTKFFILRRNGIAAQIYMVTGMN